MFMRVLTSQSNCSNERLAKCISHARIVHFAVARLGDACIVWEAGLGARCVRRYKAWVAWRICI